MHAHTQVHRLHACPHCSCVKSCGLGPQPQPFPTLTLTVPHPSSPSRAEPRSILLLFCESQVIIICIKFDCLNRSGLIGTNTQKSALPVISDSLANAFCKIALDFNNRLLVLERRARFISNCRRSPPLSQLPSAFTCRCLVPCVPRMGAGTPWKGHLGGLLHPGPSELLPNPAVSLVSQHLHLLQIGWGAQNCLFSHPQPLSLPPF